MPAHITQSIAFPKMFDVTRNRVNAYQGNRAIINRDRLLILSNPNELYNEPDFGVGLPKHLWKYNTANTKAMIQNNIKDQLDKHEPCVNAPDTSFADGLLYTDSDAGSNVDNVLDKSQKLKMTIGLSTIYEDRTQLTIDLSEEETKIYESMNSADSTTYDTGRIS